jgi:hypothetical protein
MILKRRLVGLFIMIFVIICGLGLGFSFHYGEFFIIPNNSGSTESSDNQNFDNSGNKDNENSDNSNNNNENIDDSENNNDNNDNENNDNEENIIPDNTTELEEPELPEIPTEPEDEDESEENNLTIYYQEIEKEVGKLKDHIYMMTGVETGSCHDKGIEEIEYVFTFNIDEMLEMGMICGFEDVQFIVENYLANEFAIQSECYEFAYALDETSGTLVLNFSVAEEK